MNLGLPPEVAAKAKERNARLLERMKQRYRTREEDGKTRFLHDGDCRIYQAWCPFCSCGLLHDLAPISASHDVDDLLPGYEKQHAEQALAQSNFRNIEYKAETLDKIMAPLRKVVEGREDPAAKELAAFLKKHDDDKAELERLNKIFEEQGFDAYRKEVEKKFPFPKKAG